MIFLLELKYSCVPGLILGASLVPVLYVRHLQKIKGTVFRVTHIETTCTALAFSLLRSVRYVSF